MVVGKFSIEMVTDEMIFAQNEREHLWRLSPEEGKTRALKNEIRMYSSMKKMYGKSDSKQVDEHYKGMSDDAKQYLADGKPLGRTVKPPRTVWAYEFMLHLRDGNLNDKAIELVQKFNL